MTAALEPRIFYLFFLRFEKDKTPVAGSLLSAHCDALFTALVRLSLFPWRRGGESPSPLRGHRLCHMRRHRQLPLTASRRRFPHKANWLEGSQAAFPVLSSERRVAILSLFDVSDVRFRPLPTVGSLAENFPPLKRSE